MGGGDAGVPLVVDKLERVVLDETLGQVLAHDVHELADDERHRALAYHLQVAPVLERIDLAPLLLLLLLLLLFLPSTSCSAISVSVAALGE